jgi:hypothetical protein
MVSSVLRGGESDRSFVWRRRKRSNVNDIGEKSDDEWKKK